MKSRTAQTGAVQGADEERKEDVQNSTSTAHRSRQRSNVPESTGRVSSSADEQASAVRSSVNEYEVAVLYHPDLELDLNKASSKVEKLIADNQGKITKTDNWGKRKLAYPIKKQDHAVYCIYTVQMPTNSVNKIEETLNISNEVIRYLITKPDLVAIAKAKQRQADKEAKAAKNPAPKNANSEEEE